MSLSAANSHHMVSELRLLISSNQDDPMGEITLFNPDLPPVFDEYQEEDVALVVNTVDRSLGPKDQSVREVELFDSSMPPLFDNHHDDVVMIPIAGGQPTIGGVAVQNVMNQRRYWRGTDRWLSLPNRWFNHLMPKMGQGSSLDMNGTIAAGLNMRVCDWNQQQTSKVFNPGISTTRGERIWQPLSRHWQAQELGQFFLKKGRMIRILIRIQRRSFHGIKVGVYTDRQSTLDRSVGPTMYSRG